MGIFDSKKSILAWAREQVSKMSQTAADVIRHVFQPKWSYSARRDAPAYLELFHTTPRLDPVDMISTDCANSPFKVFAKTDLRAGKNDADPLLDHPVYDLLDNPIPSRPDIDGFTLRYLTHVWWELQGDCYWIVVKDASNRPREIYPIPSNWVISAPTISIPYFLVMPQGNTASQSLLVAPENVVWFKSPNVAQPYARGRGRAEAIGDELETDEYAAKFSKNLFFNDGTPKSAVIAPGANQETLNQLRQNWNQSYQGTANASKTAFLGADMKMQILSTSPRELDFVASREFLRNAPLEHWNIPPEMMGILNNSNRATIESAKYLYMSGPVANRCMRFDSMVNRQLMPMFDARFVIKTEPAIPEDKEFNLKVSTEGWTSGAITRGEWRLRNGLSKFGNPADNEVQESFNVTMRNINATGSAKPDETGEDQESGDDDVALPTVPQDDNQPAEDEPLPPQPDEQMPVNGTPGLSPEKRAKSFSVDQRRKAWQAFDKAAGATEGPYKKAVKKIADRQQEEFNAAFSDSLKQGLSPSIALSTATLSVFGDEENAAVQKELYSSWMNSMQGGLRLANNVLDTSVSFSVVQPAFRAWIDEHGLEKAQDINDTTKELLANSLGDGIAAGESTVELETRIADQFDGLRDYRTERIARTESAGSMNFGSTATYKSAGVEKKSWLAVQDDRTRDAHAEADGQVVGVDEAFVVDGEELQYPGDPSGSAENIIQCRCSILPEFGKDDEE